MALAPKYYADGRMIPASVRRTMSKRKGACPPGGCMKRKPRAIERADEQYDEAEYYSGRYSHDAFGAADILTAGHGDRAPEELDLPTPSGKQELLFLGSIAAVLGLFIFLGKRAEASPKQ